MNDENPPRRIVGRLVKLNNWANDKDNTRIIDVESGHYLIQSTNENYPDNLYALLKSEVIVKDKKIIFSDTISSNIINDAYVSKTKGFIVFGPNDFEFTRAYFRIRQLIMNLENENGKDDFSAIIDAILECPNYLENELLVYVLTSFYYLSGSYKNALKYRKLYLNNTDFLSYIEEVELINSFIANQINSTPNIVVLRNTSAGPAFSTATNYIDGLGRSIRIVNHLEDLYKLSKIIDDGHYFIMVHGVKVDPNEDKILVLENANSTGKKEVALNKIYSELEKSVKTIKSILLINCYNEKFNPCLDSNVKQIIKHKDLITRNTIFQFSSSAIRSLDMGFEGDMLYDSIELALRMTTIEYAYLVNIKFGNCP